MSQGSEDSRAADQSTYLQIFEQFFDRADDLNALDSSYLPKLPPNSLFPVVKRGGATTAKTFKNPRDSTQCSTDAKESVKRSKYTHHDGHNNENVLRKNTSRKNRGMLKRQNGFEEEEEEEEEDEGVVDAVVDQSVLGQLEDDVFEVTDLTKSCYKHDSNSYNNSSSRNNSNNVKKVLKGGNCDREVGNSRRTSAPLQCINMHDNNTHNCNINTNNNNNNNINNNNNNNNNYSYNNNNNYNSISPNYKQRPHKKSQSFKHTCTKYYYSPDNNNPRISLVIPTKQHRPKSQHTTDSSKIADNHTSHHHHHHHNHHSFEQSKQHIDPAQKKLQLVRLMQDLDCTVVRSFVTSSKGVVSRGDSFRKKKPQVTPDVVVGCLPYMQDDQHSLIGRNDSIDLLASSENHFPSQPATNCKRKNEPLQSQVFSVLVLGDQSVGKTSLLQQFLTSEFMASADPVFDKEFEKRVSVQVDDQETTLSFVDLPIHVQKKGLPYSETEAFLVCYSITDRESFEWAVDAVEAIRQRSEAALILVANKSDLVRSRKVGFEESRAVCQKHNCKFVEVSAAFNHRVDELLVGLVHQIRLNPTRQRAKSVPNTTGSTLSTDSLLSSKSSPSTGCFRGARVFLTEFILGFKKTKSRSCDNLWTL